MWTERNIQALMAGFFVFLVLSMAYHRDPTFAGSALGHGFGIAGTVFILLTLIYPFRKRVLKKKGRQNPLNTHITYGLLGPTLVLIHSAHKYDSLIGTLLFLALLIVVLSGIIGRFLYGKVNRSLRKQKKDLELLKTRFEEQKKGVLALCATRAGDSNAKEAMHAEASGDSEAESMEQCQRLWEEARSIAEMEYTVTFFDRLKHVFSWWTQAHYVLSAFLFVLIIVHVLTMLYYGIRWLP
ncbi:MAG: hypothetical protein ACQEQX_03370 [Thermodesulfobacteriota bacterium]